MAKTPEIMAPVSNIEMLLAAIHSGADSVYIGMPDFNARGRADQLSFDDLKNLIETARLYSVKTYIAFNILIFEDELSEALKKFIEVDELCPDAWIVQDIGLAVLMKKVNPEVCLHASTQATVLNHLDILFYKNLFHRYTLARELNQNEIKFISENTQQELEVFIHGSLCISYSGQCFTSSGFGGRSANRGECAQSCRHEYNLLVDNKEVDTGGHYLVSPGDLMAPEFASQLAEAGITALKIEGRLKSPEYVASAIQIYKHLNNIKYIPASQLTFSRNASVGWLDGHNYLGLINNSLNGHTGIYLGKITQISADKFSIHNDNKTEVHKGDGLMIKSGGFETGGFIFDIKNLAGSHVEFSMSKDFPFKKLKKSADVYLTSSPAVEKETRKIFTDKNLLKRIGISVRLSGRPGEKMVLEMSDEDQNKVVATSEESLQIARKQPPDKELIEKEISALSSSPFVAEKIIMDISPDSFIPNAVVKQLRQEAVNQLIILRKKPPSACAKKMSTDQANYLDQIIRKKDASGEDTGGSRNLYNNIRLHILARSPAQLGAVLALDEPLTGSLIDTIYLDYTYGHPYRESVEKIHDSGKKAGVAAMRVYKPGEEKQLENILGLNADTILARNAAALQFLEETGGNRPEVVADFSLNVTNHASAEYYLSRGVSRVTGSYDLVFDEGRRQDPRKLVSFAEDLPRNTIEICLRYYLPSFYMDYCLFSRYLSNGRDSRSCGYPCTKHSLALKDRKGEVHPVIADNNCRNEMFNGVEKNISDFAPEFIERGVRDFRIELGPGEDNPENIKTLLSRIVHKAGLH